MRNRVRLWWDSYRHYRSKVGLSRTFAAYRACYYEIRGYEPKKFGG